MAIDDMTQACVVELIVAPETGAYRIITSLGPIGAAYRRRWDPVGPGYWEPRESLAEAERAWLEGTRNLAVSVVLVDSLPADPGALADEAARAMRWRPGALWPAYGGIGPDEADEALDRVRESVGRVARDRLLEASRA